MLNGVDEIHDILARIEQELEELPEYFQELAKR